MRKQRIQRNAADNEQQTDRFAINPLDIARVEIATERQQLEIVGFYHSHPEGEAIPSMEDKCHMIAGYSYPIVAVRHGKCLGQIALKSSSRQTLTCSGKK